MNLLSAKRMGGSVIMHNLWAWRIYLELATNSSVRRLKRCRCILYVLRDTIMSRITLRTPGHRLSPVKTRSCQSCTLRADHMNLCECIHIYVCVCDRTAVVQRW